MKIKTKSYLQAAFIFNLFISLLHTIGGQTGLMNPLLETSLPIDVKAPWLGAWHMITVILFWLSYQLFQQSKKTVQNIELLKLIRGLYFAVGLAFIGASLWMRQLAPQWILFMPLAGLIHMAIKQEENSTT